MAETTNRFYSATEIMKQLGVSRTYAYKVIKQLNLELNSKGYLTVAGKVPSKYFEERYYGFSLAK